MLPNIALLLAAAIRMQLFLAPLGRCTLLLAAAAERERYATLLAVSDVRSIVLQMNSARIRTVTLPGSRFLLGAAQCDEQLRVAFRRCRALP